MVDDGDADAVDEDVVGAGAGPASAMSAGVGAVPAATSGVTSVAPAGSAAAGAIRSWRTARFASSANTGADTTLA